MKPSDVLAAKSSETAVLLSGFFDDRIRVIGASLTMSARPGDYTHSFTLYLSDEIEMGVVALSVHTKRFGDKKYGSSIPFLLAIRSRQGEAWLDLDEQWISPKPAYIYDGHWLEVKVGEERFSTCKPFESNLRQVRYVADANLLCRYLVGAATADDVRAAAEETVAEVSRKERITELEAQVKRLEETRRSMEERIQELRVRVQRHCDEKAVFHQSATEWRTYAEMLRSILSKRLFLGKDLRQALREFPGTSKPPESPQ